MAIGVAVSESPYGPFVDALSKPLICGLIMGLRFNRIFDDDGQTCIGEGTVPAIMQS
jgi:hypothetical protein